MMYRHFLARTLLSSAGLFLFFAFSAKALAFAPTSSGGPPDGQTGVPLEAMVDRQFDANLSGATLTVGPSGNVRLQANTGNAYNGAPGGDNYCTSVSLIAPDRLQCNHSPQLPPNTWFTLTLTTGLKSSTNVALASNVTYQFQTSNFQGGNDYITPPDVVGSVPRAGTKLPINAKIRVYFDPGGSGSGAAMRTSGCGSVLSTTNIQLFTASNGQPSGNNLFACASVGADPAHPTDCNMALSGSQLIITPGKKAPAGSVASTGGSTLTASGQYVLIVQATGGSPMQGKGVKNTESIGIPGGNYYVPFSTVTADSTGPNVKGSYPQNAATGVDRAIYNISLGFTEALDYGSVNSNNIALFSDGNANGVYNAGVDGLVSTVVTYYPENDEVRVSPTSLLASSTGYLLVVGTGVKDVAGNAFDGDPSTVGNQSKTLTFQTGTLTNGQATDNTKPTIAFANANNFSVAATFSEPVKMDTTASSQMVSSNLPFVANNSKNWTLESPLGSAVGIVGKNIVYEPSTLTVMIFGVMLPPGQSFRIKVATSTGAVKIQDLTGNSVSTTGSGNLATGTVQNVNDMGSLGPGGGGGEFDFFSHGMSPIRVFPRTGLAGATSMYEVESPADTSIPSGGTIVLTFPSGFSFVADGGSSECQDALTTIENNDLNGPSTNTITIASISCSASARTVTVTTAGGATTAGDRIRFILQGIVNSTVPKDFSTSGYTVDIKTKNTVGSLLNSMTSMPFFLSTPGSQSIQGTVFNDNGAGGGTANDGAKSGTEPGVRQIRVCLGGMVGSSCQQTTSTGAYAFNQLTNGFYHIETPPISSGSFVGGPFFRDLNLSGGLSRTGENFALRAADRTITVSLSGIPTNTNLDVFAFNSTSTNAGGNIVREALWASGPQDGTDTVTLPVQNGTWEVGVGPWMPKDPSMGPGAVPNFTFMPPKPQQVQIAGANGSVSFTLQSANRTVVGSVKDGAGNAVSNAFVLARPAARTTEMAGGGVAQSKSDGSFSLNVRNGVYMVDASIPGMPPSPAAEVTVQDNTVTAGDGNSTADVYSQGSLITASSTLTLKIAKGDRSISGRVLDDSSNPVSYAHVDAQQVDGSGNPIGPFMGSPTDSSGNFTIYVKDGTWKLMGFAPGFGQLPTLTVTVAGASVTGQNLQATASSFGTVTGSVLKGGSAVAGAFVGIHGSSGGNGTVSDTSGKYTLKVQAGTDYTIDGFVPGSGPLTPVTGVTVTASQTLTGQNLTMSAPGTIQVTISGVTDAFVEARDSNGRGNSTGANPTAGVYSIPVPEGTYTVRANNPRYGLIGSQGSVSVTASQTTSVTFSPPSVYAVSGTVGSSSATCKNGASVAFADTTNGRVTLATADSDGAFSINLPNGTYFESAAKPGCVDSSSPGEITVNGAAVTGASRTLTAADATITGRVTLSGTGVTMDTKVMALTNDDKFVFADVDTSITGGPTNYTLNVTPGTWTVRARSDGYQSAAQPVTVASGESGTADLALSAISGYTRYDPQSSTVTPSRGGLVKDTNIGSKFEVNIPAGALGSSTDSASVTTTKTSAIVTQTATTQVVGSAGIEITPTNANGQTISTLSSSDGAGVTITIPYTDADATAAGIDESDLTLAVWSDEKGTWEPLATTVDATNNTLTAQTTHFSIFAAIGPRGTSSSTSTSTSTTSGRTGGGGGRRTGVGESYFIKGKEVKIELAPQVVQTEEVKSVLHNVAVTLGGEQVIFRDVPSAAWYAPYVATVLQSGIASGYKDVEGNLTGEYRPGANVTYAEIAKMVLNSARKQLPDSGLPKNRFARGDWSEPYIQLAEEVGTSVYTQTLDIRRPATRGAVIQTIVEVLQITEPVAVAPAAFGGSGAVTSGSGTLAAGSGAVAESGALLSGSGAVTETPAPEVPAVTFKDVPDRHPYAKAILLAAKLGIVSGDTDRAGNPKGTFRPNALINRAEVAKIFTKLIELGFVK